jgi:hypothetical protein
MSKCTFNFSITPAVKAEYTLDIKPFHVSIRETALTLVAETDTAHERELQELALQKAEDLARCLSHEFVARFKVEFQGRHVLRESGQQAVSVAIRLVINPAPAVSTDPTDLEKRAQVRAEERERRKASERIIELARRVAIDTSLRDMLDHLSRYTYDPDGRLNPLYDILQVVERVYGGRRKAASALGMSEADLSELGRISNDPTVLNGRHPGRAPGPHRIASEREVRTCERVARMLIEKYAATITI